jgi:oligopeptide/dipeptide ABC transporter ATP-binding protein
MSLLDVQDLKVHFRLRGGLFSRTRTIRAVDGVSFQVGPGETLGVVGESGCGKTTVARAVMRLLPPTSGRVIFEGADLASLRGAALRARRRRLQMVFQDPSGSLDPRMTVRKAVEEPMRIHPGGRDKAARAARCAELLASVGLDAAMADRYPHEFSGGQRQRIGIARALALDPKLLICDEPVSALDVSVQAQIVNLLQDLRDRLGMACLFVAHDLAVVRHISHRVAVMYLGRIVETGPARAVIDHPGHPYTRSLVAAVPNLKRGSRTPRLILPGEMPSPLNPPSGCPFHPRCPLVQDRCKSEIPALREIAPGRHAACHFAAIE